MHLPTFYDVLEIISDGDYMILTIAPVYYKQQKQRIKICKKDSGTLRTPSIQPINKCLKFYCYKAIPVYDDVAIDVPFNIAPIEENTKLDWSNAPTKMQQIYHFDD